MKQLLAFVALLVILPWLIAGRLSLSIFLFIGLYSLIVIGLTLLGGHAGQISLGQAAFYGIGAYISAIFALRVLDVASWAVWAGPVLGTVGAALVAYVVGTPILILRGHYLVLGTLGLNIVVDVVIRNLGTLTGGATGLTGIPPLTIAGMTLAGDRVYYFLIWGCVLAALWLGRNLVDSRIGRALAAIRSSEVAAASLGINPAHFKGRVFAFSAALAGLAGALYVHYLSFVSPSPFAFNFSIDLLVMSVLGGIAFLPGAVLGVALLTVLREILRTVMPRALGSGGSAEYEIVLFGLALAVVVILWPGGVWPWAARLLRLPVDVRTRPLVITRTVDLSGARAAAAAAAGESLLAVEELQKRFGGLLAVDGMSFSVRRGEIYAIIGPNGAGKTTAFNLICGLLAPTRGTVRLNGISLTRRRPYEVAALGVARTFQTPIIFPALTVLENVMVGLHVHLRTGFFSAMLGLGRREDADAAASALGYLELVGIAHRADEPAGSLPFGALRQVEIARALATRPKIILFDEPASGLTAVERRALVQLIRAIRDAGITVLLVEHDVALVMDVADRVMVLNYGERIAEGTPARVRADPRVVAAYLGEEAS